MYYLIFSEIIGIELEECFDNCILNEYCLSFNFYFDKNINLTSLSSSSHFSSSICQILPFNRNNNNKTLSVLIQGVDYYELSCKREKIKKNNERKIEENKTIIETKEEKFEANKKINEAIKLTEIYTSTNKIKCSFLPNSVKKIFL
jgi:hypothetical protein